jgi:hypothetical protein
MVTLLMIIILFACVALLHAEGMWSNAIRLINVVTAALLAMNFFEPLAAWAEQSIKQEWSYLWDFISLWGLFVVFSMIFRTLTDRLSRVKVRFQDLVDRIGSAFFAVWIAWVMVCFTMVSIHLAPLSLNCLRGSFQPQEKMFFGLAAPDRQWLAFTQKMSQGAYQVSGSEAQRKKTVFDPRGEFMLKYATRRANLENNVKKNNTLTIRSGEF